MTTPSDPRPAPANPGTPPAPADTTPPPAPEPPAEPPSTEAAAPAAAGEPSVTSGPPTYATPPPGPVPFGYPGQPIGFAPPPPGYQAPPPLPPFNPTTRGSVRGNTGRRGPRPAILDRAALLWFVVIGLGVVVDVLNLVSGADGAIVAAANQSAASSIGGAPLPNVPSAVVLLFGLVGGAIYFGLTLALRNGRNWARIVLSLFAVLGLITLLLAVSDLNQLFSDGVLDGIAELLGLVRCVMMVVAMTFMWRRECTDFFRTSRPAR